MPTTRREAIFNLSGIFLIIIITARRSAVLVSDFPKLLLTILTGRLTTISPVVFLTFRLLSLLRENRQTEKSASPK